MSTSQLIVKQSYICLIRSFISSIKTINT